MPVRRKSARRPPRPTVRPHRPAARRRRELPAIVPGSIPQGAEATAIPRVERPHAQAVCRGCGRILELALSLDELRTLADLADRAPDGWRVDGLSFTLMGACVRCRSAPPK